MVTNMISILTFTLLLTLTFGEETTPSLTFTITEEQGDGVLVGNVATASINATEEEKSNMRYSIMSDKHSQLFSLQDTTGNLYTMVSIDREIVCKFQIQCELMFLIGATSGGFFKQINVMVVVEDINDNAPLFPVEISTLSIPEGVTINSSYPIPNAADNDKGGNNGIQTYEISPASNMFGLKIVKDISGNWELEIYVKEVLDREEQEFYKIEIVARDGGSPQKSGSMFVNITIDDVNDNKPNFTDNVYNISIVEDTPADTVIFTLLAKDKDIGDNGLISYKISEQQANSDEIMFDFSVDSKTGDIKVKRKLVYQANHFYSFNVKALDNGDPAQVSQAKVLIYVIDAGNNKPKVILNLLSPGNIGFVNVSENSKTGDFVAHVMVEDTDTGNNGNVSCSVSNNYFDVVSINKVSYKVVIKNVLNREVLNLHNVTVTCSDKGSPPLSSSDSFLVRVTDYNDNAPTFKDPNYMASVFENAMEDEVILRVSATDKDIGNNKIIRYSIRNQDRIVVDANTGDITVKRFFNREVEPVVIFEVLAVDMGEKPLTGTATVTLSIKDRNDNAPKFIQPAYEFEIVENLNTGTSIGQFSAKDEDVNENGEFTFSLAPEYNVKSYPFVVFDDGVIRTNRALNREERSRYDFYVRVIDSGVPKLTGSVPVTVIVNDINDNYPNITFPVKDNKTVSVLYPSNPDEVITKVKAYDLDDGENKTLKYRIINGNELELFAMETDSGKLHVAENAIEIDQDLTITLLIEVSDSGAEPKASTAELIVNVVFTNATYAPVEDDNKYVIISVVVVIVTVLISAVIIGVIFLLRSLDKKKKALEGQRHNDSDCGFVAKPTLFIINNSGESSTDYLNTQIEAGKKKKEVSFSLDDHDSISNYQQLDLKVSISPDPISYQPEKPPRYDHGDKAIGLYAESLKMQQMIMENKQQQQIHHPDETRSETSGETNDSGRGTSEEDVPSMSPSHDDQKMFDYAVPVKYSTLSNLAADTSSRADNYNRLSPPPIPSRTYKPYASFNNNHNNPSSRQFYSELSHPTGDSSVFDTSAVSWQPQPHSQYPYTFNSVAQIDYSDFSSLSPYFRGSLKSRDDDDCSTTTSGSYTLHSIEDLL